MLNTRGELACAGAANLFWLDGEALFTPALECGVLDGVMRGALMERAAAAGLKVSEVRATPAVLAQASAVLLTNSLIGARRVASLDGRELPTGPCERFAEMVADLA
jgi:branched-chain amino acid aminotransferase/4-amino-4-deoxychorismate lyase